MASTAARSGRTQARISSSERGSESMGGAAERGAGKEVTFELI
jgi:hypothetical protein